MSAAGLNKLQDDGYEFKKALRGPTSTGQTAAGLHPATPMKAQMHLHLLQLCVSGALHVSCWLE